MAVVILGPIAGVAASRSVVVRTEQWVTLMESGMIATDGVIEISPDNEATWIQSPYASLGATTPRVLLDTPGLYRVNKAAGATATIWASSEENA